MKKIILSGGGTGGHIYPAVSVAEALKERYGDDVEILFVGAEGRMEMEKIPSLGYRIVGHLLRGYRGVSIGGICSCHSRLCEALCAQRAL